MVFKLLCTTNATSRVSNEMNITTCVMHRHTHIWYSYWIFDYVCIPMLLVWMLRWFLCVHFTYIIGAVEHTQIHSNRNAISYWWAASNQRNMKIDNVICLMSSDFIDTDTDDETSSINRQKVSEWTGLWVSVCVSEW